ncbi:MAG: tetratricopeptide repeat protein [Chloroflexi bacterium]|nr:tetratricopeptide repeat protein [Chloroflexota bacterium]
MSKRLGLIIGVNQYQDPAFRPLQFAENDARALAQWLVNVQGGKWAPSDVQHVQGTYATRELIESLIVQMCIHMAEPGDVVLIYFAGHAFLDEINGEGFLALANTRYQEPMTGIHLRAFAQQIMTQSRAAHILLILDCFQTGQGWSMRRSSPCDSKPMVDSFLNIIQQLDNRLLICSCRGNELVQEVGNRNLGLFAHRMILGVCGPAADPATGNIELRQLYTYLTNTLGEQQRPQVFGQQQSPLVLVGDMPFAGSPRQLSPTGYPPFSPPSGALNMSNGQSATSPVTEGMQYSASPAAEAMQYATMAAQAPGAVMGQPPRPTIEQQRQQQNQQMLSQAQQLLQARNFPEAFNIVEQVLQVTPNDTAALILKGQILGTGGRVQEAMAVVDQLLQANANDTMAWNMRAVLLSNMGQYQDALAAVERSLEIEANNPESYGIKSNIMANMAAAQISGNGAKGSMGASGRLQNSFEVQTDRARSFFIALGLEILGFILGTVGGALPILQPGLPSILGILLVSLGLTMQCASVARGTFRDGFVHLLPPILISVTAGGVLFAAGGIFISIKLATPVSMKLFALLQVHQSWIVPMAFLGVWFAMTAVAPFAVGIGGLIGGLIARIIRRRR